MIVERQGKATGVAMGATPETLRITFAKRVMIDGIEGVNNTRICQIRLSIGRLGTTNGVLLAGGVMESPASAISASGRWDITPDEELIAWFEGTTAGDDLYLTVHGQLVADPPAGEPGSRRSSGCGS